MDKLVKDAKKFASNAQKARHNLDILEKEYKPTFKDAVMALRVLKKTINLRNGTEEDFDGLVTELEDSNF